LTIVVSGIMSRVSGDRWIPLNGDVTSHNRDITGDNEIQWGYMVQNLKSGSCLLVEISMINLDGVNEVFYFKALLGLMPSGFYFNGTSTHPGECSSREAHGIFSVEILKEIAVGI
jgi:hypothetical protein